MSDLESALVADLTTNRDDWDGPALLGDWVILAEAYDEDGEVYMVSRGSDSITFWKELGMLETRIDAVKENSRE